MLIGHSDSASSDTGYLKTTIHNNWFDGTRSRHPRVRFGEVHVFNNYYLNNIEYGVASTMEADVLRVSQRAAKAFSKGIDTYQSERQKSAEEKTDGAVEDFVHNSAKAMSVLLKEASDIPMDIAESINTDTYRKRLRESLRNASKMIDFWRI